MNVYSKALIGIATGVLSVFSGFSVNANDSVSRVSVQLFQSQTVRGNWRLSRNNSQFLIAKSNQDAFQKNLGRDPFTIASNNLVCSAQQSPPLDSWSLTSAIAVSNNPGSQKNVLAGVKADNRIYIWNLGADGKPATSNVTSNRVPSIPDFNFDPEKFNPDKPYATFEAPVTAMALASDGKLLASGLRHGQVTIWNLSERKAEVKFPRLKYNGAVASVAFSPNNRFLAAAYGEAKQVIVFDIENMKAVKDKIDKKEIAIIDQLDNSRKYYYRLSDDTLTDPKQSIQTRVDSTWAQSVTFSPDGKLLATSGSDRNIKLWDTSSWKLIGTHPIERSRKGSLLAFSPDGQVLATAVTLTNDIGEVRLWDITDPKNVKLINTFSGFTGVVSSVAFSPNGQYLLAGSADGSIRAWDWKADKKVFQECGDPHGIGSVVFAPGSNSSFFSQDRSGGLIESWTIPPNGGKTDLGKILLGLFLAIYSLGILYYLYISRKKNIILIKENLDKKIKHAIDNGKTISKTISTSTEYIDDFGKNIEKIADDLNYLDTKFQCHEHNDENTDINVNFNIVPVVKDIRKSSDIVYKLKEKNEKIASDTNKLFSDLEDDMPTENQVVSILHPLYIVLMLLHVGLFSLSLWILSSSFSGGSASSQNSEVALSQRNSYVLFESQAHYLMESQFLPNSDHESRKYFLKEI